jgi:glycosyltransferase involved in cell wall biosynthesis
VSVPILIATLMRPAGETGVQTHFRALAEFLRRQGRPSELVTPFSEPSWQVVPIFGVRRLVDPLNKTSSVWWYRHWHRKFLERALRRRLANGQPCVIYAQCPLSVKAALTARSSPKQRVVMVVHFNISQADEWAGKGMIQQGGPMYRAIRSLESRVLPSVDGLIFVSRFMRHELVDRIPAIADVPFVVVPNFLSDPGKARDSGPAQADLINVGTLEPRKNQAYLLTLLAAAWRLGHRYTLTLVGDGPDRAALEARARELGLQGAVHFAGYVPHAADLMRRHRAYIHSAQIENLPVTLLEGMSCGLPIFAPAVGGIPEVFEDGVEGRYIPLDDPETAAKRISAVLDHPEVYSAAGSAAKRRFADRFETSVAAKALLGFLTEIGESCEFFDETPSSLMQGISR